MPQQPEDPHSSASDAADSLPAVQAPADEVLARSSRRQRQSRPAIWLFCACLLAAGATLLWWVDRRIDQLSGQLVATQDSFARISEGASAELQVISGRASRSVQLQHGLEQRLDDLQQQLEQMQQQQQRLQRLLEEQDRLLPLLQEQASQLTARLDQLQASQSESDSQQEEQLKQLEQLQAQQLERLQTLEQREDLLPRVTSLEAREDPLPRLATLEQQLQQQGRQQQTQLDTIGRQLEQGSKALAEAREQAASTGSLQRLQDEVLVLRSQLEATPEAGISRQEFDRYRQQTTRHITTLQEQWRNLQRQQ